MQLLHTIPELGNMNVPGIVNARSLRSAMDDHTQEDVSEFMDKVIDKLVSEGEGPLINELFGMSLEQKMCCRKCLKEKTFTDKSNNFALSIPEEVHKPGSAINRRCCSTSP